MGHKRDNRPKGVKEYFKYSQTLNLPYTHELKTKCIEQNALSS